MSEPNVCLKEYFEQRIAAIEKAATLASENLRTRLDSLNEWRLQNKDERSTFITRDVLDAKLELLEKSRRDNIALWISLAAIVVGIASIIIK